MFLEKMFFQEPGEFSTPWDLAREGPFSLFRRPLLHQWSITRWNHLGQSESGETSRAASGTRDDLYRYLSSLPEMCRLHGMDSPHRLGDLPLGLMSTAATSVGIGLTLTAPTTGGTEDGAPIAPCRAKTGN